MDKKQEYICSHCKTAPKDGQWRISWKTERGFSNHRCYKDHLESQKKTEKEREYCEELFKKWVSLELSSALIGDKVHFVSYNVTKPTHEKRGSRMVKVRYEEGREYFAKTGIVTDIKTNTLFKAELEEAIVNKSNYPHSVYYIIDDYYAIFGPFFSNYEDAVSNAHLEQSGYNEHCEESSRLR